MSTPSDRGHGQERTSAYVPLGERKAASLQRHHSRVSPEDQASGRDREPVAVRDDVRPREDQTAVVGVKPDVVIDRFRVPRSLEPTMPPEPSSRPRRPSTLGMVLQLGGAIAGATVVALLVVGRLPGWHAATSDRLGEQVAGATALEPVAGEAPAPSARTSPQLIVGTAAPGAVGDAIPLAISLVNPDNADTIVLNGLPAGSSITSGRPLGISGWRLLAVELGNAAIRPAPGFAGGVDLTVDLRRGNRTIDHRALHVDWTRSPRAATSAVPGPAIIAVSNRRLPPDEVSALLRRGEDLVANGDLAAGRLLLQRAAESDDARAALALAASYDPVVLEQMRTQGLTANAGLARAWYEKARQFGSVEASRRLDVQAASHDR